MRVGLVIYGSIETSPGAVTVERAETDLAARSDEAPARPQHRQRAPRQGSLRSDRRTLPPAPESWRLQVVGSLTMERLTSIACGV